MVAKAPKGWAWIAIVLALLTLVAWVPVGLMAPMAADSGATGMIALVYAIWLYPVWLLAWLWLAWRSIRADAASTAIVSLVFGVLPAVIFGLFMLVLFVTQG